MVELRPVRDDEHAGYRAAAVADWAEDLVRVDGLAPEKAAAQAVRGFDGVGSLLLFVIEVGGAPVGRVTLEVEGTRAHLGDIAVDAAHRGRGYGTEAIGLAEQEARRRGAEAMSLNVYADNPRAARLYERLGYAPVRVSMRKSLD